MSKSPLYACDNCGTEWDSYNLMPVGMLTEPEKRTTMPIKGRCAKCMSLVFLKTHLEKEAVEAANLDAASSNTSQYSILDSDRVPTLLALHNAIGVLQKYASEEELALLTSLHNQIGT